MRGFFRTKGSAKYVLLEIYEIFNVTRQLNVIKEGMMELLDTFISTSKIVDLKLLVARVLDMKLAVYVLFTVPAVPFHGKCLLESIMPVLTLKSSVD